MVNMSGRILAPLAAADRHKLREDLADLHATARRKQILLDARSERREREAGEKHFELGCWLYYYSDRICTEGIESRIDCARRIFVEGLINPRFLFFTAFDFGERHFDALFAMGDAREVVAALRGFIKSDATGNLARIFCSKGWPLTAPSGRPGARSAGLSLL